MAHKAKAHKKEMMKGKEAHHEKKMPEKMAMKHKEAKKK